MITTRGSRNWTAVVTRVNLTGDSQQAGWVGGGGHTIHTKFCSGRGRTRRLSNPSKSRNIPLSVCLLPKCETSQDFWILNICVEMWVQDRPDSRSIYFINLISHPLIRFDILPHHLTSQLEEETLTRTFRRVHNH